MTPGKLTIDQWGGVIAEDGNRLLLTGVSLAMGYDHRMTGEANSERVVATWNACQGLTPEQVAAIPRLVAWFTMPASADYLDFVVPEYHHLCKAFPRREATS